MKKLEGSGLHWHITVIVDWKMTAVISLSILILLLRK